MQTRKKLTQVILLTAFLFFSACTGLNQEEGADEFPNEEVAAADAAPEDGATDDFAEFDENNESASTESTTSNESTTEQTTQQSEEAQSANNQSEDNILEQATADQQNEQNTASSSETKPTDEFQDFETQPTDVPAVVTTEPTPPVETLTPEPITPPAVEMPSAPLAKINSVQYKANEAGGTLVIEADRPITFKTRNNSETNQLIVEIPNAQLTDRVRRPLNMKDIAGTIGAVDPYQIADSTTARFVIQMRANTTLPFVTAEGNSVLVVSEKHMMTSPGVENIISSMPGGEKESTRENYVLDESKILTTKTLHEFLDKNNKFYGKKISIETVDMPVADSLRFIAEEAGVNIVLDPDLATLDKKVNLKMRDVPWDQAFVVILKTNNLGYLRIGDLIRVTTQEVISKEEAEALRRYVENQERTPMKIRVFEVNYLKASELAPKVERFLDGGTLVTSGTGGVTAATPSTGGSRNTGTVFADDRANQLIVLDREENLPVIADVIAQFDQQPPQVLIEGRIIEASSSFSRQIGVSWNASGADVSVGGGVTLRPNISVSNGSSTANGLLTLSLGTLDVLGDLQAFLSLSELEGKIRVLSSPRVVTMNNEEALIKQSQEVPYIETPQLTSGTGVAQPASTAFKELKLELKVTPQITADSSVIMNINLMREFLGAGSTPGQPVIDKREAKTRVMVKNGQTSIIGGVYQNDTRNSEEGVPFLRDIPLIGGLFRARDTSVNKQELMVFITPRVIKAPKISSAFTATVSTPDNSTQGASDVK